MQKTLQQERHANVLEGWTSNSRTKSLSYLVPIHLVVAGPWGEKKTQNIHLQWLCKFNTENAEIQGPFHRF